MSIRNFILVLFIFIIANKSYSQKINSSDVPDAVKTKFTSMFPNSSVIKWEMENGNYEAEFKENGNESSALFEPGGNYMQTETEIKISDLPSAIPDYINKNLKKKKIKEAAKIVTANGTVTYEAEIGNEDYIFDSNGNFLSKSSEKDDTD